DPLAVVDTAGLCYRSGSSTSSTAGFDERQRDFIPAFRSIFAMLVAGPALRRVAQQAVRNFLAMLVSQLGPRGAAMPRAGRERPTLGAVNTLRSVGNDVIDLALTNFGDRRLPVIDPIVRRAR